MPSIENGTSFIYLQSDFYYTFRLSNPFNTCMNKQLGASVQDILKDPFNT